MTIPVSFRHSIQTCTKKTHQKISHMKFHFTRLYFFTLLAIVESLHPSLYITVVSNTVL